MKHLICTLSQAKELQKLGLIQRSLMYYKLPVGGRATQKKVLFHPTTFEDAEPVVNTLKMRAIQTEYSAYTLGELWEAYILTVKTTKSPISFESLSDIKATVIADVIIKALKMELITVNALNPTI